MNQPVNGKWQIIHWVTALYICIVCVYFFEFKKRYEEIESISKNTIHLTEQKKKWVNINKRNDALLEKFLEKPQKDPKEYFYFQKPEIAFTIIEDVICAAKLKGRYNVVKHNKNLYRLFYWMVDLHLNANINEIELLLKQFSNRFKVDIHLIEKIDTSDSLYKTKIRLTFISREEPEIREKVITKNILPANDFQLI